VKQIPLTQGKVALIDNEDYDNISRFSWHVSLRVGVSYACTTTKENKKVSTIFMHRLILGVMYSEIYVDHINRNGLDNRRANLRSGTSSQNQANTKINSANTSGFRGVYWDNSKNRWKALIEFQGKRIYLGNFIDKSDAIKVHQKRFKVEAASQRGLDRGKNT